MSDKKWFVYILECEDDSLYTGITTDLDRRLAEHKAGEASKYTRAKGVRKFVYTEKVTGKSEALSREAEIKSWPQTKKLDLINESAI